MHSLAVAGSWLVTNWQTIALVLAALMSFIGSINRTYDDSYANTGAKIGTDLKIRLPNQYSVRTGAVMAAQDTSEISTTLTMATQKGVDVNFTSSELTLSLDDFSKRILQPAMAVLASAVEADALSMTKDVYNQVNNVGSAGTFAKLLSARKLMVDNLTPIGDLSVQLGTQDNVDIVTDVKGLFQDSATLAKQYREGYLGRTAGFDFYESTLLTPFTPGSEIAAASSTISINGANQVSTNATDLTCALTVTNGSSKTLLKGDIITLVGCNRVHPETKADTGQLQQFVEAKRIRLLEIMFNRRAANGRLPCQDGLHQRAQPRTQRTSPSEGRGVRLPR